MASLVPDSNIAPSSRVRTSPILPQGCLVRDLTISVLVLIEVYLGPDPMVSVVYAIEMQGLSMLSSASGTNFLLPPCLLQGCGLRFARVGNHPR